MSLLLPSFMPNVIGEGESVLHHKHCVNLSFCWCVTAEEADQAGMTIVTTRSFKCLLMVSVTKSALEKLEGGGMWGKEQVVDSKAKRTFCVVTSV